MSLYNGPARGGNRGGKDQFNWDNVKADKDREYYLGHSVKATTGRWQKGTAARLLEVLRMLVYVRICLRGWLCVCGVCGGGRGLCVWLHGSSCRGLHCWHIEYTQGAYSGHLSDGSLQARTCSGTRGRSRMALTP